MLMLTKSHESMLVVKIAKKTKKTHKLKLLEKLRHTDQMQVNIPYTTNN